MDGVSNREPSRAVLQAVEAVEASIDTVVESMMAAYMVTIPSYAKAAPDLLVDVRAGAQAVVLVGMSRLRREESPEGLEGALAALGRRRAGQGVPLPDVLLAFQVGAHRFWQHIVELAPEAPEERLEVLYDVTRTMLELLETAVASVSAGYQETAEEIVADEEHDFQALIEVLAGVREADEQLAERARRRGVDLGALRWCVAVDVGEQEVGALVRSLRRAMPEAIVGRVGGAVVSYLPGDEAPDLEGIQGAGLAPAGDPEAGARRARAAARVAAHLRRPLVRYEDVVPLAAVLDGPDEERQAFVDAWLGPVLADSRGEELLRSLTEFYASGLSLAAAARNLFVHRHTLEYRLNRIEALLGADPKAQPTRLFLELALALRD
ncbi:MAG: helix-turn-helix domain-containing protein [Acidimicrobiia bacterium]|nr:helix-turn-helix domain-containing protein [Acidimicrobiia bacterium]